MESIEKNDIIIDKLFGWKGEFNIKDSDIKVYMRVIGDADINRSRVFALRESAKLRRLLHDKNSDEYLALLSSAEYYTREELQNVITSLYIRDFAQDAVSELIFDLPPEPGSDATLEQQEEYQKQVDEFPIKRSEKIREFVTENLEKKTITLEGKPQEELLNRVYLPMAIDTLCETRMMESFRDMCVYLGTYKDPNYKIHFFTDLEEYLSIKTTIKLDLREKYNSLELGIDELKK